MTNTLALNLPLNISFRCLKFFRTLSLIFIICLIVFYIIQVTGLAQDRYVLAKERKAMAKVIEERAALEIEFSKIQSGANLDASFLSQNFEKDQKTKYIQIYSPLVRRTK